ncbi:fibronectin type III domain-containing protein, partial [Pseudoalteromonas rhizosphaerae]|uniref:fibronectin type III domain-containing protein n=2 Tax=Gammaproteobacteria TaxID=1236 RepID=UPI0012302E81
MFLLKQLKRVLSWLTPEVDSTSQGTQATKPSSDDHIKIVYGTRKVSGTVVFMNVSNPDDGDDVENDLLHLIIVWCEGGIDGVEDILLNDISITDSKFAGKKYRAAYAYHFKNGMGNYSDPELKAAGWDAASKAHRLDGLACSYVRLEWSIAEDAPFTGVPDITAIIRGKKVKNLHTNAVEYSENPAYILHDYLTHPIYGKPLSASDYSLQHFKDAALIANTLVPAYQGATTTQPLFTCNVIVDTGDSILTNVELLAKSMRGLLPIINGELSLIIEQDDPVTPEVLNETHFKSSLKYTEGGKSKRYNRVIVEYIDKALNYSAQDAYWPEKGSDLEQQWLAQDNNVLLEYRFKVSSCTNYYEARQMARVIAMLSREALNFNVTAAPIAMQFTVGDVVPISHKKLGWINKPFRLLKSEMQDNGDYKLNFREHQPYIYNWLSGVVRPPIPDTSLPPPRNVLLPTELAAIAIDDGHIKISWVSPYNYFDIRIYKNDIFLTRAVTAAPEYIVDKLDAGSYEIDVRARSNLGYHSEYATLAFDISTPASPTVLIDSATYNTIAMSATVLGASLGTTFEWQFLGTENQPVNEPNTHTGYSYTYTGLQPNTQYTFRVRTKNTAGLSPWVDVLATTTQSDLLEFIDSIPLTKLSAEAQNLIADINAQVDRLRPETENNLPSLIAKNIDALTGLAEKVQVLDAENPNSIPFQIDQLVNIVDVINAENPNNLQQQLAESNSKINDLARVTEVLDETKQNSLPALIKINNIAIEQQRLAQQNMGLSLLNVTSAYTNWRNEYERRAFNNERLIDAAVYVDQATGTIVNRAFAYADESFNSATLMIEGVNSKITLASQQIAQSQNRISQAEAQLIVQAAQINQKATFSEVESQIAGALAALQPAYSWQFNTSSEGFDPDSHNAL